MSDVAYVLRENATASGGPIVFAGVPGIWAPDSPVTAFDLGSTEEEMDELIEAKGLPLDKTTGESQRAEGQMVSGADVPFAAPVDPYAAEVAEDEDLTSLSRDELEKRAAAAGVADPKSFRTKNDLAKAIEAAAESTAPAVAAPAGPDDQEEGA